MVGIQPDLLKNLQIDGGAYTFILEAIIVLRLIMLRSYPDQILRLYAMKDSLHRDEVTGKISLIEYYFIYGKCYAHRLNISFTRRPSLSVPSRVCILWGRVITAVGKRYNFWLYQFG
jgi:hypothetical protein